MLAADKLSNMISIRQSVNDLERRDQLLEKSITCLFDAVHDIHEYAFEGFPAIASQYRPRIEEIESKLNFYKIVKNPDAAQVLTQAGEDLRNTLKDYSRRSVENFRQDTANLRDILGILGSTAESLNSHNLVSADEFRDFGRQLEELTLIEDPTLLRQSLFDRAVEFRSKIDELSTENRATIMKLQKDVSVFRKKLDEAEMQAATDSLTGTYNRRELQRQIDMRIEVQKPFTLLMFDLNEFKSINDRFGHAAGDQVLKHFANAVRASVRPCDVVARWGGDEFIVIFDSSLEDAIARSRKIFARLASPVAVKTSERTVMLGIRASSGVAEHLMNESAPELFARVDALLYANKPTSRQPSTV